MNKKIISCLKLQILAQSANPSLSNIGPILGQRGLNIIEFCRIFNEKTTNFEKDLLIPVIVHIFIDKTFCLFIKYPTVSFLLKKEINIKNGSKNPGKEIIASISKKNIIEIAKLKINDMNTDNIDSVIKCIYGTAKSMGIEII